MCSFLCYDLRYVLLVRLVFCYVPGTGCPYHLYVNLLNNGHAATYHCNSVHNAEVCDRTVECKNHVKIIHKRPHQSKDVKY